MSFSSPFYSKKNSIPNERINPKDCHDLYQKFWDKWNETRQLHPGQQDIINAFFKENKKYLFVRMGRKGAKTTSNILAAWGYSLLNPNSMTFIVLPTITQAIEVYWDEKRLQQADLDDTILNDMFVKETNNNKHTIKFVNGSQIKLSGTWSEKRGRGTQPNLLIVDEIQDCSEEYLDAMEPNLAAKADSRCIMSGTPPRKKNHYHTWESRIVNNPDGFRIHHSSYINTALPHLKDWLDRKRDELISAGKEDVWKREYLAEDCFSSDDRVLPDVKPEDHDEILYFLKKVDPTVFTPFVSIFLTESYICTTYGVLLESKYTGVQTWILKTTLHKDLWTHSFNNIYEIIKDQIDEFSLVFKKTWRKIIFDETNSFHDVIGDVQQCRTDFKWKQRGFPLLKEMILSDNLTVSTEASDFAFEAQSLLKEDNVMDYPYACSMAIIANEFYQTPTLNKKEKERWDKLKPLRDFGIICNPPERKSKTFFRKGWE